VCRWEGDLKHVAACVRKNWRTKAGRSRKPTYTGKRERKKRGPEMDRRNLPCWVCGRGGGTSENAAREEGLEGNGACKKELTRTEVKRAGERDFFDLGAGKVRKKLLAASTSALKKKNRSEVGKEKIPRREVKGETV